MNDSLDRYINEGDTLYNLKYKVFGDVDYLVPAISSICMKYSSSVDYRWQSMYWKPENTIKITDDNHKLAIMIKYGDIL